MENNNASKRKASSQCPPTLSARWGVGGGETEKFVMLAKRKEDLHFLNF